MRLMPPLLLVIALSLAGCGGRGGTAAKPRESAGAGRRTPAGRNQVLRQPARVQEPRASGSSTARQAPASEQNAAGAAAAAEPDAAATPAAAATQPAESAARQTPPARPATAAQPSAAAQPAAAAPEQASARDVSQRLEEIRKLPFSSARAEQIIGLLRQTTLSEAEQVAAIEAAFDLAFVEHTASALEALVAHQSLTPAAREHALQRVEEVRFSRERQRLREALASPDDPQQ